MPCCQCATTPLGELIAKSSFGRDRHRCYFPPEKLLLIPLRPGDLDQGMTGKSSTHCSVGTPRMSEWRFVFESEKMGVSGWTRGFFPDRAPWRGTNSGWSQRSRSAGWFAMKVLWSREVEGTGETVPPYCLKERSLEEGEQADG